MPRQTIHSNLDHSLQTIISRAANEISQAVRHNIAAEIARIVTRQPLSKVSSVVTVGAVRTRAKVLCPVPGCGKPTGGPRWGWFCTKHKDLPEAEKAEHRANRKNLSRARRTERTAGQRKRLLPCPFPGCGKPGKGPRFSWFCEDHRTLPKEERDRIRAKAGRVVAKIKKGRKSQSHKTTHRRRRARKG